MEKDNLNTGTPEQDEDAILPEGYGDEDIFEEPSRDDENIFGKEDTIEGFGGEGEDKKDPAPEDQPQAQEPEKEDGVGAEDGSSAPADAQQENEGFRFQQGGTEVTVKETDLPELYRKAQEHQGLTGQLAQARRELGAIHAAAVSLGFENAQKMLEKVTESYREGEVRRLVDDGVNEEVARYMVEDRMKKAPQQHRQSVPARDVRRELSELMQHRPALREELSRGGKLPQEVIAAARNGTPLLAAYAEYETKEAKAEAERVRQENDILKQNEKNAARAPVKSATAGGGDNTKGKDHFLEGFESDN